MTRPSQPKNQQVSSKPTLDERNQGIVRDERGQEQPADKKRAQQSAKEGPAAYAPHDEGERAFPDRDPAKKKTGEF